MEQHSHNQNERIPCNLPLKHIIINASKANLWPRTSIGPLLPSNLKKIIPSLRLTPNFRESLSQLVKDSKNLIEIEKFIKSVENPAEKNQILLQSIQFFSRTSSFEQSIKLIQSPILQDSEFKLLLKNNLEKIEAIDQYENLSTSDLCSFLIQFYPCANTHKLKFSIIFPNLSLKFNQISNIKLVSTPLSTALTSKEKNLPIFVTGFLTMDQKKRLMPLQLSDKFCVQYPLVGIWVKGIGSEINTNSDVWCACVRFIEIQKSFSKLSPNPDLNTFLVLNFTPKPVFYEVSSDGKAYWKVISKVLPDKSEVVEFLEEAKIQVRTEKKSLTASTSSSESKFSGVRSSIEVNSTEKIILQQNIMLKNLEKQINELQHALSADKLVNSATNTTNFFTDVGQTKKKVKNNPEKSEFSNKNNLLRSSCDVLFGKKLSDSTFTVPKIIYQSDNDSYEEEPSLIEIKYLK